MAIARTPRNLTSLMTSEEVEELLLHLIRTPTLLASSHGLLDGTHFGRTETAYAYIWSSLQSIILRSGIEVITSGQFSDQLYHEIAPLMELKMPGYDDPTPFVAERVLENAFSRDAEDIDVDYGVQLLQRFLHERAVRGELTALALLLSGNNDENLLTHIQALVDLGARIESLSAAPALSFGQDWDGHEERLSKFRGRELVGLKTGFPSLDKSTLGLRGLGTLGAGPGVGKTALALNIALGVCRHHVVNNAVVIFLSLEMPRDELYSRIKCNLADMEWRTLTLGSAFRQDSACPLNPEDVKKLQAAKQRMVDEQIGTRLIIYDRQHLPDAISADQIATFVRQAKERTDASRALVIVDYLQILPVPPEVSKGNDLEADRYRIRLMQDVLRKTSQGQDLDRDAVLFISEARKPTKQQDGWGNGLAELMGSARLGYAVDFALLYRRMTDDEVECYFPATPASARAETLQTRGIAPIIVSLEKGRDGMTRGEWPMEFHFWKSIFKEIASKPMPGGLPADEPDDDSDIEDTIGDVVAAGDRAAKGRSRLRMAPAVAAGAGDVADAAAAETQPVKKRPK